MVSPHDPNDLGRGFKQQLRSNTPLLGASAAEYLRPSLVKIYRHAGFDFIYIEKEHGLLEGAQLSDFVQCARDNGIPAISKIAENNRPEVTRVLDAGVVGIQLPRTESSDDLMELIDYIKYPPLGSRAAAPSYGNVDYVPPIDASAWLAGANEASVVVAHIETRRGYENAEQIVTTSHLDMVYVGPYDFSIAMGHPGEYDNPHVARPMEEILELCKTHNVPFGTSTSTPRVATQWIAKGCRFFEIPDERDLILSAAVGIAADYRHKRTGA